MSALPLLEDPPIETDNETIAHIFHKADITRSAVTGQPIEALCGIWIVVSRTPDGLPICATCSRLAKSAEVEVVR